MNRFWKILEENWKDNENFLNYLLLGFYWNFFFFLSSETEKKEGNFEATSSCVCVFGLEDKKGYWICCCCYSKIKSWLADIGWLERWCCCYWKIFLRQKTLSSWLDWTYLGYQDVLMFLIRLTIRKDIHTMSTYYGIFSSYLLKTLRVLFKIWVR